MKIVMVGFVGLFLGAILGGAVGSTALDATGLHALEQFAKRLRQSGRTLVLCGARDQPAKLLEKADFIAHIGPENIVPHVEAALYRAREIQDSFGGIGDEFAEDLEKAPL